MASGAGLAELFRAAEAAGFAMAAPDDDIAASTSLAAALRVSNVEDLARGARDVKSAQSSVPLAVGAGMPSGGRSGAQTVRETVYGYLRFGVPA